MNILHDFFEIPTENHLSISLHEILYQNEKILWQGKPTGKHLVQDSEKITTGISFIIYFVGEMILLYKLLFTAFSLSNFLFFFFLDFLGLFRNIRYIPFAVYMQEKNAVPCYFLQGYIALRE